MKVCEIPSLKPRAKKSLNSPTLFYQWTHLKAIQVVSTMCCRSRLKTKLFYSFSEVRYKSLPL